MAGGNQYAQSEIFDYFRQCWGNDSNGYAQQGSYWYLVRSETTEGGGFFKEVFDGKVEAEKAEAIGSRPAISHKAFTETITKAFKEDMDIGLVMYYMNKVHQYVVWGAEYNDEGYVSGVYYVNPNDFRQHSGTISGEHIGLFYMDIVYREDGGAYTEAGIPGNCIPIKWLEVYGIWQDIWEEYFRTHPDK